MAHWWNETVTNGDIVLELIGALLFYAAKQFVGGFIDGWKRNGISFREEVHRRVEKKRPGAS